MIPCLKFAASYLAKAAVTWAIRHGGNLLRLEKQAKWSMVEVSRWYSKDLNTQRLARRGIDYGL
jgi:hypothetical protein